MLHGVFHTVSISIDIYIDASRSFPYRASWTFPRLRNYCFDKPCIGCRLQSSKKHLPNCNQYWIDRTVCSIDLEVYCFLCWLIPQVVHPAVAGLKLNKWQWIQIGNRLNLLPAGMKQTYRGNARIQQITMYTKLVLYTHKQSVKYVQCINRVIHTIKGEALPATHTHWS